MKILVIGDVMGRPGLNAVRHALPRIRARHHPDLVIANAENIADGAGLTRDTADELFNAGVDVLTNGNHAFDKAEALEWIVDEPRLLRPHNYPASVPGSGLTIVEARGYRIAVLSLLGNVFMQPRLACPFHTADEALATLPADVRTVILDFHAEATSEKTALGWYLDGRVTAVLGTHTHIPTADECILPGGTAYQTDLGMTGCYESVIGLCRHEAIRRFVHKVPAPFTVAEGPGRLCGALLHVDPATGRCRDIERIAEDEFLAAEVRAAGGMS